jgi:phenylacetate-CoA ligase
LAHGHRQRVVLARFVGRKFGYREMIVVRSGGVSLQLRRFYAAHSWTPHRLDFQREVLLADEPFDAAVERINRFRPDVVRGYGSHLGPLFRWAWERGRPLSGPKAVLYGADPMSEADRSVIEDRLGIPVLSTYQAVEALRLGFQCERRQGFHLDIDQVAVWVRGEDGRPVEPGGRGDLILSNLTNRATVLLNYRLGDVVSLGQRPCPCGRNLPTVDRIDGRCDDAVLLPDGQIRHSLVVLRPLFRIPGVVQVQVIQEELRRFRLRVVCAAGTDWKVAQQQLHTAMQAMFGPDILVQSERFDAIPPEPSGKVRAVVSRCRTST